MQEKNSFLTPTDQLFFERSFDDVALKNTDEITFRNFRDILNSNKKFNRNINTSYLEKIIKGMTSQNEDEIYLNIIDYFHHLENISLEQHKFLNERDPEIRMIFELLALGEDVIYKKKIVEIIKEFELPISIDDFFRPIDKKEVINFSDFCYLFKATNESGEMFLQTFASSFYNLNM